MDTGLMTVAVIGAAEVWRHQTCALDAARLVAQYRQ
jgi:hypothetical protein